ncbi:helix-turn-helix transcriptional regulator [Streptomyces durbertensis]|uniref:Helix-turn-helix transcriptional regulator n=1 Tax=Streptomyces durbertensis TaxID=2448886 RepID=A0ABR6EEK8_9ACTN|nr:helix-turn-helix transcriptional regulator [Streptomyces durbertensis]MBB1243390.1 helix-turn-helix transcriptional regulator [Streptomyces durbertensis]
MANVIGANIRRLREARGWSQSRLAREVCRLARVDGEPVTRQEISRYETGRRTPREWLPFVAEALGVSAEELRTPTARSGSPLCLPSLAGPDDERPAANIRRLSQQLVFLDNQMHGLPIADIAVRSFRAVHRRLGAGGYTRAEEREVRSAAAELAEIAGWALFNEGMFEASRRFNQEALLLARLAHDRSVELITLQNMGMVAGWTGRAGEELAIARCVLEESPLSPRVEAMFRGREAQGLAGAGHLRESVHAFDRARSLLQDGAPDDEPHWAWWVTEQEIDRQHGRVLHGSGRWREAIPVLRRALTAEGRSVGYQRIASVMLLDCLLDARAWREAQEEVEALLPAISDVSSAVTLRILGGVTGRASTLSLPGGLRDGLHHLEAALEQDPYGL